MVKGEEGVAEVLANGYQYDDDACNVCDACEMVLVASEEAVVIGTLKILI
jgi:hypothetical protein